MDTNILETLSTPTVRETQLTINFSFDEVFDLIRNLTNEKNANLEDECISAVVESLCSDALLYNNDFRDTNGVDTAVELLSIPYVLGQDDAADIVRLAFSMICDKISTYLPEFGSKHFSRNVGYVYRDRNHVSITVDKNAFTHEENSNFTGHAAELPNVPGNAHPIIERF